MRPIFLLFLSSMLTACNGLVDLGPKGPPPEMYTLEPLERAQNQPEDVPRIIVEEPQLAGALGGSRIAVRRSPVHIEYLANAQWVERTPRLIQRHLTASLDNSAELAAIGGFNIDEPIDYRLRVDVRDFHAEIPEGGGAPTVRVSLSARLLKAAPPDLVAAEYFSVSQRASANNSGAIVAAFNDATNQVVRDLVAWAVRSAGRPAAAAHAQP